MKKVLCSEEVLSSLMGGESSKDWFWHERGFGMVLLQRLCLYNYLIKDGRRSSCQDSYQVPSS